MTNHEICVHDADILWYKLDILQKSLEMEVETASLPCNCHHWLAKIIFSWVFSYNFEDVNYQNVIFDIDKEKSSDYFEKNKKDLEKIWEYNLFTHCSNLDEVKKYLDENDFFVYHINSSFWLIWFVIAKNMEIIWI